MGTTKTISAVIAVIILGAVVYFWSGQFNVSADTKHWAVTEWALEAIRERSVKHASTEIDVPDNLDDKTYYAQGAGHYQEMCSSCHLAPGKTESELRMGLYPRPPAFIDTEAPDPQKNFWIVKHGLKMTGMPAWGKSHSDEEIWKIVAFTRQVKHMDESTYMTLVEQYSGDHSHGNGSGHEQDMHSVANDSERTNQQSAPGNNQGSEQKKHDHHDHAH